MKGKSKPNKGQWRGKSTERKSMFKGTEDWMGNYNYPVKARKQIVRA